MNKDRRANLAKAVSFLQQAQELIGEAGEEEQDCFDNLSEGLQQAERGVRMEEVASELADISGQLEEFVSQIEACCE